MDNKVFIKHFQNLVKSEGWQAASSPVFPVSLEVLLKYIDFELERVNKRLINQKALLENLDIIETHHEHLGLNFSKVRYHDKTKNKLEYISSYEGNRIVKNYIKLAISNGWVKTNDKNDVFPITLAHLHCYIDHELERWKLGELRLSSLNSYLSSLNKHHKSLGYFDWDSVKNDKSIREKVKVVTKGLTLSRKDDNSETEGSGEEEPAHKKQKKIPDSSKIAIDYTTTSKDLIFIEKKLEKKLDELKDEFVECLLKKGESKANAIRYLNSLMNEHSNNREFVTMEEKEMRFSMKGKKERDLLIRKLELKRQVEELIEELTSIWKEEGEWLNIQEEFLIQNISFCTMLEKNKKTISVEQLIEMKDNRINNLSSTDLILMLKIPSQQSSHSSIFQTLKKRIQATSYDKDLLKALKILKVIVASNEEVASYVYTWIVSVLRGFPDSKATLLICIKDQLSHPIISSLTEVLINIFITNENRTIAAVSNVCHYWVRLLITHRLLQLQQSTKLPFIFLFLDKCMETFHFAEFEKRRDCTELFLGVCDVLVKDCLNSFQNLFIYSDLKLRTEGLKSFEDFHEEIFDSLLVRTQKIFFTNANGHDAVSIHSEFLKPVIIKNLIDLVQLLGLNFGEQFIVKAFKSLFTKFPEAAFLNYFHYFRKGWERNFDKFNDTFEKFLQTSLLEKNSTEYVLTLDSTSQNIFIRNLSALYLTNNVEEFTLKNMSNYLFSLIEVYHRFEVTEYEEKLLVLRILNKIAMSELNPKNETFMEEYNFLYLDQPRVIKFYREVLEKIFFIGIKDLMLHDVNNEQLFTEMNDVCFNTCIPDILLETLGISSNILIELSKFQGIYMNCGITLLNEASSFFNRMGKYSLSLTNKWMLEPDTVKKDYSEKANSLKSIPETKNFLGNEIVNNDVFKAQLKTSRKTLTKGVVTYDALIKSHSKIIRYFIKQLFNRLIEVQGTQIVSAQKLMEYLRNNAFCSKLSDIPYNHKIKKEEFYKANSPRDIWLIRLFQSCPFWYDVFEILSLQDPVYFKNFLLLPVIKPILINVISFWNQVRWEKSTAGAIGLEEFHVSVTLVNIFSNMELVSWPFDNLPILFGKVPGTVLSAIFICFWNFLLKTDVDQENRIDKQLRRVLIQYLDDLGEDFIFMLM
ncbi:hypothetical protein HDU92_000607 [Lobulomyces angularis]|nr:hypothetical protein HDU92_000607 [Lobulomyces angularis]